jgi:catechol 2,3-dioxygenase-like lactoylglutathione lyase family enzyme
VLIQADLDHVAVATPRAVDVWPRYAGDLGGEWQGGGATAGFYSAQVKYRNGMKLEVLEPVRVEENDFLARFLAASGPGPHHFTFKVPDIRAALVAAEEAGYQPINVNLDEPSWMEAFLHPKAAHGIVVQLAQAAGDEWGDPAPDDLPAARVAEPAALTHLTHVVADLAGARHLFERLLGGAPQDEGDGEVLLAWPGPGRIRLVEAKPATESALWLGGRPGRLHHVALSMADPSAVPDAVALQDGRFEVRPEDNLGVRLVLSTG